MTEIRTTLKDRMKSFLTQRDTSHVGVGVGVGDTFPGQTENVGSVLSLHGNDDEARRQENLPSIGLGAIYQLVISWLEHVVTGKWYLVRSSKTPRSCEGPRQHASH